MYGVNEQGGCREINGLGANGSEYHAQYSGARYADWREKGVKITRLRLLSDPGFPMWDVSYCHGVADDGELVRVQLPFNQLPKRGMMKFVIAWAKREGVYAKGTGIFEALSTLN